MCPLCLTTFVSSEHSEPGMKMPPATWTRHRITDPKPKPEQGDGIIRNTGAHLRWP